jgi:hypothetical protein
MSVWNMFSLYIVCFTLWYNYNVNHIRIHYSPTSCYSLKSDCVIYKVITEKLVTCEVNQMLNQNKFHN